MAAMASRCKASLTGSPSAPNGYLDSIVCGGMANVTLLLECETWPGRCVDAQTWHAAVAWRSFLYSVAETILSTVAVGRLLLWEGELLPLEGRFLSSAVSSTKICGAIVACAGVTDGSQAAVTAMHVARLSAGESIVSMGRASLFAPKVEGQM